MKSERESLGAVSSATVWEKLCEHFAETLVERWHDDPDPPLMTLAEFMGLSEMQYSAWVEGRWGDLLAPDSASKGTCTDCKKRNGPCWCGDTLGCTC